MSRSVRPGVSGGGAAGGGRQPPNGPPKPSGSKDLVTRAYNNKIIVKNQDGEYAPIGMDYNKSFFHFCPS